MDYTWKDKEDLIILDAEMSEFELHNSFSRRKRVEYVIGTQLFICVKYVPSYNMPVSQSCAEAKSDTFLRVTGQSNLVYKPLAVSKARFSYSHNCTLANGAVIVSAKFYCPVSRQKFSLEPTAHDCETGLYSQMFLFNDQILISQNCVRAQSRLVKAKYCVRTCVRACVRAMIMLIIKIRISSNLIGP